ncbi:uncharacterized protein BXZ73DRAFT_51093 [Epithele typhae]|uniref:uncharacterized protein n=1 Tax=Epithele typhae TaxID=378194 RepID=UPI0020076FEF|nr:uncharacterized protein BXZ73DRAFT_51093 [Epithele typhae]KAH9923181.1 hypothetical protein BXZ73DRAFT_51093 [Epithele typhae]
MSSPVPYYGPDEDEATINLERFFLAGDFVTGFGYGVQFVLWAISVRYLWNKRPRGRNAMLLLSYITLLLVVETIFAIVQARTVELMYIDNRNYPGGPWQYFLATQNLPVNVMFFATLVTITLLCDILVFWRCWVIWSAFGRTAAFAATFVPLLTLIASFVMGTLWTLQSSHPGLSLYSAEPLAFGTAYYTLSLGTNVLLTALITTRLLLFRREHAAALSSEHGSQYLSLATLVVESAALYSAFAVAFLVSYALNAPINQIWLGFAQAAQQVATYLIIFRVADGTAWTTQTMRSATVTTIDFRDGRGRGRGAALTTTTRYSEMDAGRRTPRP